MKVGRFGLGFKSVFHVTGKYVFTKNNGQLFLSFNRKTSHHETCVNLNLDNNLRIIHEYFQPKIGRKVRIFSLARKNNILFFCSVLFFFFKVYFFFQYTMSQQNRIDQNRIILYLNTVKFITSIKIFFNKLNYPKQYAKLSTNNLTKTCFS